VVGGFDCDPNTVFGKGRATRRVSPSGVRLSAIGGDGAIDPL